ncbi:unnamed protein product [Absidia cylindrospora]
MTVGKIINTEFYDGYEYPHCGLFIDPNVEDSSDEFFTDKTDQKVVFTEKDVILPRTIIPKPTNSPFVDAISPSTLIFLATLKENNHRNFMRLYQNERRAAKRDFQSFVGILGQELHHDIDDTLPLDNIRKSNQSLFTRKPTYPTEFKARFGRPISRNVSGPSYTISVKPGNETTVSVGVSHISPARLEELRPTIVLQGHLLREALSTEDLQQIYGEDNTGIGLLDTEVMMKVPNDIAEDVPNIELLSFCRLLVITKFNDDDVVSPGFLDEVLGIFRALAPFYGILCDWLG